MVEPTKKLPNDVNPESHSQDIAAITNSLEKVQIGNVEETKGP